MPRPASRMDADRCFIATPHPVPQERGRPRRPPSATRRSVYSAQFKFTSREISGQAGRRSRGGRRSIARVERADSVAPDGVGAAARLVARSPFLPTVVV